MHLQLPSSPASLYSDRFSILDIDDDYVPFWEILQAILKSKASTTTALIDQLETIAVTLRGTVGSDFGHLRAFLDFQWPSKLFFEAVWPKIVKLALEMPTLFPSGMLQTLSPENPRIVLSRRQVGCLVIHQFLCSLPAQPWETDSSPDFHVWYSSNQPHSQAVTSYLTALFTYSERLVENDNTMAVLDTAHEWPITFILYSVPSFDKETLSNRAFMPLHIIRYKEASTAPTVLGLPHGASVISANKNVGFGPSGTQEETHVGSTPEACPVVLITPTLRAGDVLIVQGVEAMITVTGYGRDARLEEVLSTAGYDWRSRTMLFMDALELDEYDPEDVMPDLLPGHLDRELKKAYTAFSSRPAIYPAADPYTEVFTGMWGCRTFAGNPQIKAILQWCAASISAVQLKFVCSNHQEEFAESLEGFVRSAAKGRWRVNDVLAILKAIPPSHADARRAFEHIEESMRDNI